MKKENVKDYVTNKNKKYKLNKLAKAVIAIGLIGAIGTSGMLIRNYINNEKEMISYEQEFAGYEDADYYDVNENNPEFEIKTGQDSPKKVEYVNNKIDLSTSDFDSFINYLDKLEINYKYEDLYELEKAYAIYEKNGDNEELKIEKHSHDIRSDGINLTVEDLYNTVIKNNKIDKEVVSGKDNYLFDKLSNKEIKRACEIIVDTINKEVESNPDLDLDEICCSLYDLQMFSDSSAMANAYIDKYNRMVINLKEIEDYQALNKDVNAYEQVIVHETEHLIQNACSDMEKKGEYEIGNSHKYEGTKTNPLYYSWLIEASAERKMSQLLEEEPSTYPTQITYLESLMMIGLLNEDYSLEDIENLTFNKDPNILYDAFYAKTEEEKLEVNKLLYNIEIMQSGDTGFYELYNSKYNADLLFDEIEKNNLNQELRIEILESFSKKFYHGLASQLKKGSMTLSDVMYMINMYESDLYLHLLYNETDRIQTSGEFFDFYVSLQNSFFEMISPYVNYEVNELVDILNDYSMYTYDSNGNVIKNYDLSSLDSDKARFMEEQQEKNYNTGIPTIQYMKNYYNNNFSK